MGVQITVEINNLLSHGCTIVPNYRDYEEEYWDDEQGDMIRYVRSRFIHVIIPGEGIITSYVETCLCFDCRNMNSSNYWVKEWLVKNNIPFIEG